MAVFTTQSTSGGVRVSLAPKSSSGYSSYSIELRWDPSVASVDANSVVLIGTAGDVNTFNQTALTDGVLKAAGFTSSGNNFTGASTLQFVYKQNSPSVVNFALTQELYDSVSASTSTQVVAVNADGSLASVVSDNLAPTVIQYTPALNAVSAGVKDNLVLNFSEGIRPGSGNLQLIQTSNQAVVEAFDVTDTSRVVIRGNTLTVDPTQDLLSGVNYSLRIPSGSILDIAGNSYAGTSNYSFLTAPLSSDTVPPSLVDPTSGTSLPSLNAPIVLTFSEPIKVGQGVIEVHTGSITGTLIDSFNVATTTRATVAGNKITLTPSANWPVSSKIYLVVPGSTITDIAGNAYAGTSSLNLSTGTTVDIIPPTLANIVPPNNGTLSSLDASLQLTFSELVLRGTGKILLKLGSPNGVVVEQFDVATSAALSLISSNVTIKPSSPLLAGMTYSLIIPSGAIIDGAGNIYAGLTSQTFSTPISALPSSNLMLSNATASMSLNATQVKSELPNLPSGVNVNQLSLGNNLVLSAKLDNGALLNKIVANASAPISGLLPDTAASLSLSAPAAVSLEILGPPLQVGQSDAKAFIYSQIEQALPQRSISNTESVYKASLQGVIADASLSLGGVGSFATKIITPKASGSSQNIGIQGKPEDKDLMVLNMFASTPQTIVSIVEVSTVVVAGPAAVSDTAASGVRMYGDMTPQTLMGGSANDWIDGGGGNDTLVGGGGSDKFVMGSAGRTTIQDFSSQDTLCFRALGITNFKQLVANLVSATDQVDGALFQFAGGMEVKLIGYKTTSDYPQSMFEFIN